MIISQKIDQKIDKTKQPVILGLEASGEHASAAVVQGGVLIAEVRIDQSYGHASYFVSLAHDCVQKAGLRFADISHIAAGVGPGSFTGLRVCLSAAKGFVLAGGLVGVGVNGLRARAFAAYRHGATGQLISCADTRRGVYFHQTYDETLTANTAIEEASYEVLSDKGVEALIVLPPLVKDADKPLFDGAVICQMSASDIALLASHDMAETTSALMGLDPLYVAAPKLGPRKSAI